MQFLARHLNNCSITASINQLSPADDDIRIFPNPVSDRFTLKGKFNDYQVELLNAVGQVKDGIGKIANNAIVDVSWLPNGIYFLRLKDKSTTQVKLLKFIKILFFA